MINFKAQRTLDGSLVTKREGDKVTSLPSPHYDWGTFCSGAFMLAEELRREVLGHNDPELDYTLNYTFARQVLANLPWEGWELGKDELGRKLMGRL